MNYSKLSGINNIYYVLGGGGYGRWRFPRLRPTAILTILSRSVLLCFRECKNCIKEELIVAVYRSVPMLVVPPKLD